MPSQQGTHKTSASRSEEALTAAVENVRDILSVNGNAIVTENQFRGILVVLNKLAGECVADGMDVGQKQMVNAVAEKLRGAVNT